MRSVKWFLGILVTLVLVVSFLLYIFKDDIINYAVAQINKNLKTEVHVDEIDVTFWGTFPNLSLDFNGVFIQDAFPYATRKDTLLYTEQIRLKFNPMDIWNEKYNVKKIDIKPGTLQLKVDKKGAVNYDIFRESESKEKTNFDLTLESIHATGIRFSYSNRVNENSYKTKVQDIQLAGNFTQDKFDIATKADFYIQKIQNGLVPFIINQQASTDVAIHIDQISEKAGLLPAPEIAPATSKPSRRRLCAPAWKLSPTRTNCTMRPLAWPLTDTSRNRGSPTSAFAAASNAGSASSSGAAGPVSAARR